MRNPRTALAAGVSLLAFAACAGQGSAPAVTSSSPTYPIGAVNGKPLAPAAAPAARGFISPTAKPKKLVYIADTFYGDIGLFSQSGLNQTPIGTITSGLSHPAGLAFDKKGNLYAANEVEITSGSWTVPMYAPGATKPTTVFSTDLNTPTDVAVANDGTIYICNFNTGSNGWINCVPKG
jgi:hypothetical protein